MRTYVHDSHTYRHIFGRRLSEKHKEESLFWEEVKNERDQGINISSKENEVKDMGDRGINGNSKGNEIKDVDGEILRSLY